MDRAVFPLCCLTWHQRKVPCKHCHTQCPRSCSRPPPTHASTRDSWTIIGKFWPVSCVVTGPFSWVLVLTRFCLCPPKSVSPVLRKFCNQIPLASKVKFPGGSQSLCQIPRLGNLLWIYVIKHLSKPIECTTPRVNPNINCGHWVIMMCQGRLTSYNSVPSWWRMLMMKEATHM